MAVMPISRDDLGAGTNSLRVDGKSYVSCTLTDVQGKKVHYKDCDFSFGIVERGYFHDAVFENCRFIGTRFNDCVFRSATFRSCHFDYADFHRCILPVPEILANLPDYANVRWELLHNL